MALESRHNPLTAPPTPPNPGADEYNPDGSRRPIGQLGKKTIRRKSPKRTRRRITRVDACVDQIEQLPRAGEELLLLLDGRWHGWDIIRAVAELAEPAKIDRLDVATLGFNKTQTEDLAELLDEGTIKEIRYVISDLFTEKNRSEFAALFTTLTDRGQKIVTTRNHSKILCFALSDGRKIAAHGSLNLRRCNSFEQMALANDRTLYDFLIGFLDEMEAGATP